MKNQPTGFARQLALAIGLPVLALVLVAGLGMHQIHWAVLELSDMGLEDMPLATHAAEIDGNLMDEALEAGKVLRASFAAQSGDTEAPQRAQAAIQEFERLAAGSEKDFDAAHALIVRAMDDPDVGVRDTYAALDKHLKQVDRLQQAYEDQAHQLFALVREQRHEEAVQMQTAVRKAQTAAEQDIAAFVSEVKQITGQNVRAAEAGAASAQLLLAVVAGTAVLASVLLGAWLSRRLLAQLGGDPAAAAALARRVADGDLSAEIALRPGDSHSLMAQLMAMQAQLREVVQQVRVNAESVQVASGEIAQGNSDLSARTESQASALQQTAASMEQLNVTVRQNADHAQQADQLARDAMQVAGRGGAAVEQMVETMKGIDSSSQRIADIIGVIDGIAFQTNILALNAAVEAARAGEQGRGFAVVASEVRSLAQRSADAAKEIKSLITASVEQIGGGATQADQARNTMLDVVAAIERVGTLVGEISNASVEQSAGVSQVGEAVTQMDQATQQNAALVEESAAAAESLRGQAVQLVASVATFKLA